MKVNPSDRRVKRTYHLEPYQVAALKLLSAKTRIKQVDFLREAIDGLILKYQEELSDDLTKNMKNKLHKE